MRKEARNVQAPLLFDKHHTPMNLAMHSINSRSVCMSSDLVH